MRRDGNKELMRIEWFIWEMGFNQNHEINRVWEDLSIDGNGA